MKTKLLILSIIGIFTFNMANAQIEQGTGFVAANSNFGFASAKSDTDTDALNILLIGLKGGYFFAENLVIGALIEYQGFSQGDSDINTTTLGLFGRYYINGAVFLGAGYNSSKSKSNNFSGPSLGNIALEAGYAAFISDAITIEPSLVYAIGTGDNTTNSIGLNVGFGLYFGR